MMMHGVKENGLWVRDICLLKRGTECIAGLHYLWSYIVGGELHRALCLSPYAHNKNRRKPAVLPDTLLSRASASEAPF